VELALPNAAALDDLVDMLDDQLNEAAGAEADAKVVVSARQCLRPRRAQAEHAVYQQFA
jgi:hypothetical protein